MKININEVFKIKDDKLIIGLVGCSVKISQLEKNDLFYMEYGGEALKFRVHFVLEDAVLAHGLKWLKKDSMLISEKEYGDRGIYYAGKISKLRAWFKL